MTLFKIWSVNGGFDLYNVNLKNNNPNPLYSASNSGWVLGGRMFSNLRLKNGWGLQGGGGARGKQVNLQGSSGSFAFYSIGVRKDLPNGKGNISLSTENFLNHPFRVNSNSKTALLEQYSTNSFYNAGIRLGVSYRIGKMTFEERRRKSVNNDDLKGDGGGGADNGGGDQQNQQQGGRTQGARPAGQGARPGGNTPGAPGFAKDSTGAPTQSRGYQGMDSLNRNRGQWQGRPGRDSLMKGGQGRPFRDSLGGNRGQWNILPGHDSTQIKQGQRPKPDMNGVNQFENKQGSPEKNPDTPNQLEKKDSMILIESVKVPAIKDSIPPKKQG